MDRRAEMWWVVWESITSDTSRLKDKLIQIRSIIIDPKCICKWQIVRAEASDKDTEERQFR